METWKKLVIAFLALALAVAGFLFYKSSQKKKLIAAIMAKDSSLTKLQLQQLSNSQLQALLDGFGGNTNKPPSHPGNTVIITPPAGSPPPPPPAPLTNGILKRGAKLFAKSETPIYENYSTKATDFWGVEITFSTGEYVGQVIQDGPFGGMIHVSNYSTTKIDQTEFYVQNKAYTITN